MKIILKTLSIAIIISGSISYAQTEIRNLNEVDSALENYNLPIANGIYHSALNAVYSNSNYFKNLKAISGFVNFKGQKYYNIFLKYDVYEDQLIYFLNENNRDGIQLDKTLVTEFSILDRLFTRIDKNEFIKQTEYYEVLGKNDSIQFLCKYKKTKKNINENTRQYIEFYDSEKQLVFKENKLFKLNKSWLLKNYPALKKEIKAFYKLEQNLYEVNVNDFYAKLFLILQ